MGSGFFDLRLLDQLDNRLDNWLYTDFKQKFWKPEFLLQSVNIKIIYIIAKVLVRNTYHRL